MEMVSIAIFINFTNHESALWGDRQRREAEKYGEIIDLPFPSVHPCLTEQVVDALGNEYANRIIAMKPKAVICQGEFALCFVIVCLLLKNGITVLCSCSERRVTEFCGKDGKTEKNSAFEFVRFRRYWEGKIDAELFDFSAELAET